MGTDHRSMKAWMEPVFEKYTGWQRIYLDLPALGRSKVADWVKTTDDILDLILVCLESIIANRRFALAAKSFGAYIAQGIFHKREKQIDGLSMLVPPLHKRERTLPRRVVLAHDAETLAESRPILPKLLRRCSYIKLGQYLLFPGGSATGTSPCRSFVFFFGIDR